jgi:6-phosphogluconolactonase (cycloisomerase 2 family)
MPESTMTAAVFVQTNEPDNRVIAFARAEDGGLTPAGSFETGGAGDGRPHLTSQGSVVLTGDGRNLLVANAASDDVSVFEVREDATLELVATTAAGSAPKSIAERDGLVYVLATGKPAVVGFRLADGGLAPIAGGERALASLDADPAQVSITPDGAALVVTERGTNSITVLPLDAHGRADAPQSIASSGPTPYGFAFTTGGTLVVTEAFGAQKGAAAASSYSVDGTSVRPITRSAGNGRSEICWAVVTPDDRFAFTTNFADGAVSRYAVAADGTLTLEEATAGVTVDGRPGLRDEGLSGDGRYLYAIDADAGSLFGWAVGGDGRLTSIGSWGGLPPTVAGLASR